MTNPITPDEVKSKPIPDIILEIVNKLIQNKWDGKQSLFYQQKLVQEIVSNMSEVTSNDVFENNWLNFEEAYRKVGWIVEYEKPLIDESFEPHFIFRKRK